MIKLTAIIQQINGLCGTFKRFNSFHGLPIYTHNNSKGKSVWKNTINTSLKPVLLEILDIAHKDRFLVRMIQDDFFPFIELFTVLDMKVTLRHIDCHFRFLKTIRGQSDPFLIRLLSFRQIVEMLQGKPELSIVPKILWLLLYRLI